ncbi:hypothetical protein [Nocardioides halotolerans]|uniref:hypothetical protein n=1 Tax=Nocardioides halotolerans TaxID=433660 RepID=UPI00042970DD|nr:hypothetical protein [Nocardioides halotolerans]
MATKQTAKPTIKQTSKTTQTITTKNVSAKITLSPTLEQVAASEGIDKLRELQRAYGIIPAAAVPDIEPRLDRLETLLRENAVTAGELATNQPRFLSMLTGVPLKDVTGYHATEVAEELHAYRNLALAVAALAASTINVDSEATSPKAVYTHATKLALRSIYSFRPCAHDEIVLLRVAAHLAAIKDPRDHAATVYTLLDAGQVPGETTHVTIEDYDDPEMPQLVLAAGNRHLEPRFLTLDQFATHTLGRHLEHALRAGYSRSAPLTYRPRVRKDAESHAPGSTSAIASAQRIIDRLIQQLGLPTVDITASSITQWRVATTLATRGAEAAWQLSGRSKVEGMYRALGGAYRTTPTARPDDHGISFAD